MESVITGSIFAGVAVFMAYVVAFNLGIAPTLAVLIPAIAL